MTKDGVCLTAIKLYERLKSLNIYDHTGARIANGECLTQQYVDYLLQTFPEPTEPEITDPDHPDYENPETEDTNWNIVMHHTQTCNNCMICGKQVYNSEIFYKHVFWHTTQHVNEHVSNLVSAEDGDGDPTTNINTFKVFKASNGWLQNL